MNDHSDLLEREKRWLLDEKYAGEATAEYEADASRLEAGEVVDYLIGHREFLGCHIGLSFRPLIPRNETEFWASDVITAYQSASPRRTGNLQILDMCAGSGCIGIALLAHLSQVQVDFAEYNPDFISQIKKNLEINNIDPKWYRVFESDLFTALPDQQYDLIVANPPYIARNRRETVQDSVHSQEDHGSLYADDDGLSYIKQIIAALPRHLAPEGECYIEYDPWQTDLISRYLESHYSNLEYHIIQDQNDKDRVIKLTYK